MGSWGTERNATASRNATATRVCMNSGRDPRRPNAPCADVSIHREWKSMSFVAQQWSHVVDTELCGLQMVTAICPESLGEVGRFVAHMTASRPTFRSELEQAVR